MGRKIRKKKLAGVIPEKGKTVKADDYFRFGPPEIARFGKAVVMRNSMSQEQAAEMRKKLAERFPNVELEIDHIVSQIAEMVSHLPPDELLKRAHWEMAYHHSDIRGEFDVGHEGMLSLRMVDYIQSIVASVEPATPVQADVSEEAWQELGSHVGKLFIKLNGDFFLCQAAAMKIKDPDLSTDYEHFFFKAQGYWCNVRGQRYIIHDVPILREVLSPHDSILRDLYGIGADDIASTFEKIQDSLTRGISRTIEDYTSFQSDADRELDHKSKTNTSIPFDREHTHQQLLNEPGWRERSTDIAGRLVGMDMFDVEKLTQLPRALLDDLSWSAGEDKDFFVEGKYRGWPLRVLPVFKRPFLKLDNRYFCFDLYSLFDNSYRVFQRLIIKKKPAYSAVWKDKQQEVSERIPTDLLKKLLPGAQAYRNVYYRWHTRPEAGKNWCETDCLLIYDDFLFVLEVRGGAFTYTSPTTDFESHIESLKNLVLKPAEQGRRFMAYLESADSVKLYDSNHNEIATVSRKQFEHVVICAITLDPFTELASKSQHLKKIGITVGPYPIWSISIDDLWVYSDVFTNPQVFLHYAKERMKALTLDFLETEDELDHLGLYLKHNLYTEHVEEAQANAKGPIKWHGYRVDIDRFFSERFHNPNTSEVLQQQLPSRLKEILDFLAISQKPGRRELASTLLDCSGEWRNRLQKEIAQELKQQTSSGKPKALSGHGDSRITLFCWQREVIEANHDGALDHAYAVMLAANDPDRLLLELSYDNGRLVDINHAFISSASIPKEDMERLKTKSDTLKQQRLVKAKLLEGPLKRNQLCPCGSGKKYKKCCLPLSN